MKKYEELFDEQSKIKAFDKLAELFYSKNFGEASKSDIELLMFSIYLEKILDRSQSDFNSYSDYLLSKELGITQSRVANLKVKKELKYPYSGFDWKVAFSRVVENAKYENGKIIIHIPDKNLFIELQNVIESNCGILDIQLNSKLLKISPTDFVNLLVQMEDDVNVKNVEKDLVRIIKENLKNDNKLISDIESLTFKEALIKTAKEKGAEFIVKLVPSLLTANFNGGIKNIASSICNIL